MRRALMFGDIATPQLRTELGDRGFELQPGPWPPPPAGEPWDVADAVCALVSSDARGALGVLASLRERAPELPRVLLVDQDVTVACRAHNEVGLFRMAPASIAPRELARVVREAAIAKGSGVRSLPSREELEAAVQERTALLSRGKREWELTFDAIATPLVVIDPAGRVVRANLAAARARGLDIRDVPGRGYAALVYGLAEAPEGCPVTRVRAGAGHAEAELEAADGALLKVSAFEGAAGDNVVCSCQDVTDERRRRKLAFHTEKMVALGQLAGGVAHEINNPVASILAFASLLRGDPRPPEDLEAIDAIEQSAQRCKRIVDNMLRFSRRETSLQELDLSAMVRDAAALFQMQVKQFPKVCFSMELLDGLPPIRANPAQLEQVVLNMLQNGLHALPSRQGKLGVRTLKKNGDVGFQVWDTGTGISPENLPRIFEPTFTTKAEGEGTGFGLAIAETIVNDHGGHLHVQSALGEGTTFSVYLPIHHAGGLK